MIRYRSAKTTEVLLLKEIVHQTICEVYPKYYPHGVVSFFLEHHSEERLKAAIHSEYILFAEEDGKVLGTGSFYAGDIRRMFILPEAQGKGLGRGLLKALQEYALQNGGTRLFLDASLPGYGLYEKEGFVPIQYHRLKTPSGEYLCYFQMEKQLPLSII